MCYVRHGVVVLLINWVGKAALFLSKKILRLERKEAILDKAFYTITTLNENWFLY